MPDLIQLFPTLPRAIEDALRLSIQRFGVLVPVVKDQHGRILDGHHRVRLAEELGVSYLIHERVVHDDEEAQEIARTLNADRRQLTEEQRREVAVALRAEGHSVRAIAGALGVGKSTVDRDLAELSHVGQLDTPARILGLDGKSRPATRSTHVDQARDDERSTGWLAPLAVPPQWTPFEQARKAWVTDHGGTTLATLRSDAQLIAWAEDAGLLTRIDRLSKWGNPFEVDKDGSRAYVIESFAEHYLPRKPSLLAALPDLKGRVLVCWCLPEACHGLVLLEYCDRLSYEWLIEQMPALGGIHAD